MRDRGSMPRHRPDRQAPHDRDTRRTAALPLGCRLSGGRRSHLACRRGGVPRCRHRAHANIAYARTAHGAAADRACVPCTCGRRRKQRSTTGGRRHAGRRRHRAGVGDSVALKLTTQGYDYPIAVSCAPPPGGAPPDPTAVHLVCQVTACQQATAEQEPGLGRGRHVQPARPLRARPGADRAAATRCSRSEGPAEPVMGWAGADRGRSGGTNEETTEGEEMTTIEIWTYREQLFSAAEIVGFSVEALDGSIGKIDEASDESARATWSSTPARGSSARRCCCRPA